MIKVYDNLLNDVEKDRIENFLRDPKFPWFLSIGYNHYTTNKEDIEKNTNQYSSECVLLTHVFYMNSFRNSDNYQLSDFVLNLFLERSNYPFKSLIRSKANLTLKTNHSTAIYTTPHIDYNYDHTVLIYYANDSDGDTVIFEDHKSTKVLECIEPKKGRFLTFDGNLYHSAGLNKIYDLRMNLNFNIS
jgi:hypothetical protein